MGESTTFFKDGMRRLRKNPLAMGSIIVLVLILLTIIIAPHICPYKYSEIISVNGVRDKSAANLGPFEYSKLCLLYTSTLIGTVMTVSSGQKKTDHKLEMAQAVTDCKLDELTREAVSYTHLSVPPPPPPELFELITFSSSKLCNAPAAFFAAPAVDVYKRQV